MVLSSVEKHPIYTAVRHLTTLVLLNLKTSKVWHLIFLDPVISSREPVRRNQTGWRSSEHLLDFFTACSTKGRAFCQDQGVVIPGGNHRVFGTSIHAVYTRTKTKQRTFTFYVIQLQRVGQFLLWQRNIEQSVSIFSFWLESKTVSLPVQTTW